LAISCITHCPPAFLGFSLDYGCTTFSNHGSEWRIRTLGARGKLNYEDLYLLGCNDF
jgi:hypothetical protein